MRFPDSESAGRGIGQWSMDPGHGWDPGGTLPTNTTPFKAHAPAPLTDYFVPAEAYKARWKEAEDHLDMGV